MSTGPELARESTMDSRMKNRGTEINGKISSSSNPSRKFNKRPEDRANDVVIDEDFRLSVETLLKGIASLPENWKNLTVREQRDWVSLQVKRECTNLPESLSFLWVGNAINVDNERSEVDPRPDWLDHEKFLRGQRFAMENFAAVSLAQLLSLYTLLSFENGLKPLIITGKSSEPFTSFKRYLSTIKRIKNWYSTDVWTRGTIAHKEMQVVRKMHSNVRKSMINSSLEDIDEASEIKNSWSPTSRTLVEDFRGSCPAAVSGQCPHLFTEEDRYKRPKSLNQMDMSVTQCGFVSLVILFPEYLGIHGSTDDDLDAFCYTWRSFGYLLGIEDEFNFCAGTIEEVKQRSRDYLEYWVKPNLRDVTPEWEHMLRCLMEGVRFYFPVLTYEYGVLFLAEMLNIPMPRLQQSMSYFSWFRYTIMKHIFYWISKLPGAPKAMSALLIALVERALNLSEKQLGVLKERSNNLMAQGIAETIAARRLI